MYNILAVVTGTVQTQSAFDAFFGVSVPILILNLGYPLISVMALMRVEMN